ncbi:MAG: DUF89 family protein [Sedimentisphaerales bacterium]|nr:DUF89 family protein [Sedimentisphaerales bacterium]
MKTYLECVPCFVSQALHASQLISDDPQKHKDVLQAVLQAASNMDFSITPPAMGQHIHRIIRRVMDNPDPYLAIKNQSNTVMLKLYPQLQAKVADSPDPFETALRLAIAGNIIDYAVNTKLNETDILQTIEAALHDELPPHALDQFRQAIDQAQNILYLADNAGEIILDRLLVEKLPLDKLTVAVRGKPVINDALIADAQAASIPELVEVIDNGSDAPGTILQSCSSSFRARFQQADLIIAKGQGNYETLSNIDKNIFYLFKVKCPVIARNAALTVGDLALQRKIPCANI